MTVRSSISMGGGAPRRRVAIFYRIVLTDPPTVSDFLSTEALGRAPRFPTKRAVLMSTGISVYETFEQARRKTLSIPGLGDYIARLEIPPDAPIRKWRTDWNSPGHWTLYGAPALFLALVASVEAARRE